MKRAAACALLAFVTAVAAEAQKPPAIELGFKADRVYDFNAIDSVNAFNGNAIVTIPIGMRYPAGGGLEYGLTLVYNSKAWDYKYMGNEAGQIFPWSVPNIRSNAGTGWRLSMGRLLAPTDPETYAYREDIHNWVYEGPSGDEHAFSNIVYNGGTTQDPDATVQFTADGSYLRMTVSGGERTIEFPDGKKHTFTYKQNDQKWRLTKIADRYGNEVNVRYDYDGTGHVTDWWITDTTAASSVREHRVHFRYLGELVDSVDKGMNVDYVSLQGVTDGQTTHAKYTFNYYTPQVPPSCFNQYYGEPGHRFTTMAIPFLGEIVLPDDPSPNHDASYHFHYVETDTGTCDQGLLDTITLPTRGSISYTYQLYALPDQDACKASGPRSSSPGIKTRTLNDGSTASVWTYVLSLAPEADVTYHDPHSPVCTETKFPDDRSGDPQWPQRWSRTSIISPPYATGTASRTDHYFDVYVGLGVLYDDTRLHADTLGGYFGRPSVIGCPGWDRAKLRPPDTDVPIDDSASDTATSPRYLSEQVWGGCTTGGDCSSGALLRSTFRRFVERVAAGSERELQSERTVAHDDKLTANPTFAQCVAGTGCRYVQTDFSDFDGVGHMSTRTSSSNYPANEGISITEEKVKTGYPVFTSTQLDTLGTNWVFTKYSYQERTITTKEGTNDPVSTTTTSDFCFDVDGVLTRKRARAGTNAGVHDVISTYDYDSANLTEEKTYGGDSQTVGTGAICQATLPATPRYWNQYTYANGRVATGTYVQTIGSAAIDFKTIDYDSLSGTGLVTTSRGVDGLATTYGYNVWGSLKSVQLPGELEATYEYAPATPSTPAKVTMTKADISMVYEYDGLGRLHRTERTLPGAGCVEQIITYDGFGRHAEESVWKTCGGSGGSTRYGYDALGRVTSVTAPDDSATTMAFVGDRIQKRTMSIDGVSVITTEERDVLGRLASVTENDDTTSEALTTYAYDIGDRLIGVKMTRVDGGVATTQTRSFTYDGRGFLLSETHPELGTEGNGTIVYGGYDAEGKVYGDYDARGHALTRTVGTDIDVFDQQYVYDDAEHLTLVESRSAKNSESFRTSKSFDFLSDDPIPSNRKVKGKLRSQTRHNYQPFGDISVSEAFTYDATNGHLYQKDTTISDGVSLTRTVSQQYTFDQLGELSGLKYPWCSGCGEANLITLVPTYQNGLLRSITNFVTQIDYSPSGTWSSIQHGDGTIDTQTSDHGMARPATIAFSGLPDCTAPHISSQPADQTVATGGSGTLSVTVTGSLPSFQWHDSSGAIAGATGSTYHTLGLSTTTQYWVQVTNGCGSQQSTTATVTVLGNPSGLSAARYGTGIRVTWSPAENADHYEVEQRSGGGAFSKIADAGTSVFDDPNVTSGSYYAYRVRAFRSTVPSAAYTNADLATMMTFSTIAPGVGILLTHVEEIRAAVNGVRGLSGLAPLPWTGSVACVDSILGSGITPPNTGGVILATHVTMLRQCMNGALTTAGFPTPPYTDPSLPGIQIKAVHFTELQGRAQ